MKSPLIVEGSRHHTKFLIFMTVLVSSAISFGITFGVIQNSDTISKNQNQFKALGTTFMSPSAVVNQVKTLGGAYFWMGPLDKSIFTIAMTPTEVGTIIYWPVGTSPTNFNIPRRIIRTYPNLTIYAADHHSLNMPADIREIKYTNGTMQYGIHNMNFQTFIYPNGLIVEINYAEPQTEAFLSASASLIEQIA